MRNLRDFLLDLDDRGRITALVIPVLIVAALLVAGSYACSRTQQESDASNGVHEEETDQGGSSQDTANDSEDSENKSEQQKTAENGREETDQQYLDTGAGATPNGYQGSEMELDSSSADTSVKIEKGQTITIGSDTLASGISASISPADVLSSIRACTGDETGAIEAALTGEALDEKYRQIAVVLKNGSAFCLEMASGTDKPITARKISTDDLRKINLGNIVGHAEDEAEK